MPRSRSAVRLSVEISTSGVALCFSDSRTNFTSSSPLMSGMLMSVMMRSNCCRGRTRSASKPLCAVVTSKGPPCSRVAVTKLRIAAESSTTSTRRRSDIAKILTDSDGKAYFGMRWLLLPSQLGSLFLARGRFDDDDLALGLGRQIELQGAARRQTTRRASRRHQRIALQIHANRRERDLPSRVAGRRFVEAIGGPQPEQDQLGERQPR